MSTARYAIAVLLLVALPPGLALWFVIHPFARHWRRLGAMWTYVILTPPMAALMYGVYSARATLVGSDLGASTPLMALAALTFTGTIIIALKRKKYLTTARLVGVPELSQASYPGVLLNEGIYSRIRHPRYVEILLACLAYALFANYTGLYALVIVTVPTIHLLVLLEERELRQRFGRAYDDYAAQVPRYLPFRS